MEKYQDMHIHTTYSDGSDSLSEIVESLESKGVGTFAITDHDNIDSVLELRKLNTDLEWYSGVEVSTIYGKHKIHLLGYGFDPNSSYVKELLELIKEKRKLRFYDMISLAEKEFQIKIPTSYFESLEQNHTILGRPHLMRYLKSQGVLDEPPIMDRISSNCASKVSYRVDLKKAIEALKKAKALVLIAHPKEIEEESHIEFESLIEELLELGIDGLEVYHSIHTDSDIKRYMELTKRYHLLESGGSDYHGLDRKGRVLGCVSKSGVKVKSLSLVDELRDRRC